ncbi:hypothetical protein HQ39_05265 [Porphyromonas sp. COT-108 OH2963]|nr:hypothetical protein HQ39_05265 [Porphyromonas sp. COT-108 OH2963]
MEENFRAQKKIFSCARKNIYARTEKKLCTYRKKIVYVQKKIFVRTKKNFRTYEKIFSYVRKLGCFRKEVFNHALRIENQQIKTSN